jgi:hypothetical protein
MSEKDLVLNQLSISGFPFQLRVENEVIQTRQQHGWDVETREQAWASYIPSRKSGYIDLVLRHSQLAAVRLVVECKRQRNIDARQLQWLFLVPEDGVDETDIVRCLTVEGHRRATGEFYIDETGSQRPSWVTLRLWDDIRVKPVSFESQFCFMQGDTPKDRPLLERLCGDLLDSLDGLVEEEIEIAKADTQSRHLRTFNIPVVVTNAQLYLCALNVGAISLQDGTISPDQCKVERVPFLRFRKSLSVDLPDEDAGITNIKQANLARERTVFIVNSESLTQFLSGWEVKPFYEHMGYAVQQMMSRYSNR